TLHSTGQNSRRREQPCLVVGGRRVGQARVWTHTPLEPRPSQLCVCVCVCVCVCLCVCLLCCSAAVCCRVLAGATFSKLFPRWGFCCKGVPPVGVCGGWLLL